MSCGGSRGLYRERTVEGEEVAMNMPPIVSPQEWEAARQDLLVMRRS
jgi:hypothetical protein